MSTMALRCLLQRIPRPLLKLPRAVPPPASRSMSSTTLSHGGPRTSAELHDLDNLAMMPESFRVRRQRTIDEGNRLRKESQEIHKAARLRLEERKNAVEKSRKLGDAAIAVIVAFPVLLICGSKYQA